MSRRFERPGVYALVDGRWWVSLDFEADGSAPAVLMPIDPAEDHGRPIPGELSREWRKDGQSVITVDYRAVDEVVSTVLHGRYRGVAVILGHVVTDGMMYVYPESMDRHEAAALDFDGDERISGFSTRVRVGEVTEVLEEVKVLYRRGVPPL